MPQPHSTLSRLAIAWLLSITLAYFWNLGGAPPALSGDEVLFAIHGKSIATTGCDLNGRCWPVLVQIEADASSRRWYQPILFYAEAVVLSVLPMTAERDPTSAGFAHRHGPLDRFSRAVRHHRGARSRLG